MNAEDSSLPYSIKQLILAFRQKPSQEDVPEDIAKIQVNNTISRLAFFYEKFRNAVDYKEEHLLRKNAIKRVLKRRLVPGAQIPKVARHLIYELIRGRYLPNNAIPETRIGEVANTINNYVLLLHEVVRDFKGQEYYDYRKWILGIAAVELEQQLVSAHKDEAVVDFAFRTISENLEWNNDKVTQKDKNVLLYIAIHRALIKSDTAILTHHLWNFEFGEWKHANVEMIQRAGRNIEIFKKEVDRYINHEMNEYLLQRIKRTSVLFQILKDVIDENPDEAENILADQEVLNTQIRNATAKRYKAVRIKLQRSVTRSLIYLFFTKTMLALLIELPYDRFFMDTVNYIPLAVNILFHPIFLFALAVTIGTPGNKNTERVIHGINGILSPSYESRPKWRIRPLKRRFMVMAIFQIIYGLAFVLTFGGLISALALLHFNAVSIAFFIFFLTVVSFLGIKLRQDSKELQMQTHKEGIIAILVDFFTMPIVRVGHWVSLKAPKVNVFVFFLDIIFEAPFKSVIEISEQWVEYVKEKKDELY